ncbi:hypothetical protein Q5752_000987 [Cryptotrichosporon argae]
MNDAPADAQPQIIEDVIAHVKRLCPQHRRLDKIFSARDGGDHVFRGDFAALDDQGDSGNGGTSLYAQMTVGRLLNPWERHSTLLSDNDEGEPSQGHSL